MEIGTRNEEERRWVKEYEQKREERDEDVTGKVRKRRNLEGGGQWIVEVAENLKLETRITLCAEEILKMKKRLHVGLRKIEARVNL